MKVQRHKWNVFKSSGVYDKLNCSLFFGKRNFLKKQDPAVSGWSTDKYHEYYSVVSEGFSNLVSVLHDNGYTLIVERSTLLFARRDNGVVPENSLYEAYNGMHFSVITKFEYSDSSLWDLSNIMLDYIGRTRPLIEPFLSFAYQCTEDKFSIVDGFAYHTYGRVGDIWNSLYTKLFYVWFMMKGYTGFPFVLQCTRYVSSKDGTFLYNPNQDTDKTRIPSEFLINDEELGVVEMYGHKFFTYPEKYIDKYLDLRYGNWRENYIKVHGRTTFS